MCWLRSISGKFNFLYVVFLQFSRNILSCFYKVTFGIRYLLLSLLFDCVLFIGNGTRSGLSGHMLWYMLISFHVQFYVHIWYSQISLTISLLSMFMCSHDLQFWRLGLLSVQDLFWKGLDLI